jgi:hypothetical protein
MHRGVAIDAPRRCDTPLALSVSARHGGDARRLTPSTSVEGADAEKQTARAVERRVVALEIIIRVARHAGVARLRVE